jgi:serine protease Do
MNELPRKKRDGLRNALTLGAIFAALATGYIWRGAQVTAQPGTTPEPSTVAQAPVTKSAATQEAVSMQNAFGAVVKAVEPSVVTITTKGKVRPAAAPGMPGPGGSDPFEEFFKRFRDFGFNGNSYTPKQKEELRRSFYANRYDKGFEKVQARRGGGLGSGMIYRADGFILTNAHVVADAETVDVKLNDGREMKGKVIGRDERTDVAVVKVDAKNLPVVKFGDSSKVNVGDWAIAVGNPFGLEHTVTVGVISATAREVPLNQRSPGDYLQTDASINPGNSGGPLCDIYGRVIGVNNAIFSESGGNIGIGFAIPIATAADIADTLAKEGKVRRGYLGVRISDMDKRAAAFGLDPNLKGVLIEDVSPNTPGARAGLQPGDVVTAFNGKEVTRSAELQRMVGRAEVNSNAKLTILRGGKEMTVTARLDELKSEDEGAGTAPQMPGEEPDADATAAPNLGLSLSPVTPKLSKQFGLKTSKGLVIVKVDANSPAANAGLRPGDVIERVAQTPVTTAAQLQSAVNAILNKQTGEEKSVALYVTSRDAGGRSESRFVVVTVTK